MTHPVWKTAGALGPTRGDVEQAFGATMPVMAAGGVATGGLGALLKLQDLADRQTAHEQFGSLEELIRRIKEQEGVELPPKLRLLQTTPVTDRWGMGYAALPNLAAKVFGTQEALYTPWTFGRPFSRDSDIGELLTGFTKGEMIDFEKAIPADAIESGADLPDKPAGRIGAMIREVKDNIRAMDRGRYLRDRASYSPSIVMHELGHLNNSARNKIRALQGAGIAAPLLGGAAGFAAATAENPYLSYAAPGIVLAGMTPTLIEEARASIGAQKMMQQLIDEGAKGENMKALYRALGPAYGTYALGAAVPALAAGIVAKIMREKHERGTLGDVWAHGEEIAGDAAAQVL